MRLGKRGWTFRTESRPLYCLVMNEFSYSSLRRCNPGHGRSGIFMKGVLFSSRDFTTTTSREFKFTNCRTLRP